MLIVGRRTLAWPGLSRPVARLHRRTLDHARRSLTADGREVLLLNPAVRRLLATDPRVTYRPHDVFQPWTGEPPDVIKIANVLRRLYFSDKDISRALTMLLTGLTEGGQLLLVDNPRIPGIAYRAGLYRRDRDRFTLVDQTMNAPEIADLVEAVRAGPPPTAAGNPARAETTQPG